MATSDLSDERERKNRRLLEYVEGRLDERTSAGQCILHLAPGGHIRRIEWRDTENAEDILDED